MPWFDRYTAPHFQGIDHDVVTHGMPGGATTSSQEGALKQGYIDLLPYMLRFLAGTRKIIRYHDVTPGSQITWNTAFLAVTSSFQRGGKDNPFHVPAPSNGDLWIMYVSPGDIVKKGEELFNITIMKQEKAVLSPMEAVVKRVVKTANYKEDKKMVPVREGELIVELREIPRQCSGCDHPMAGKSYQFCPMCGEKLGG